MIIVVGILVMVTLIVVVACWMRKKDPVREVRKVRAGAGDKSHRELLGK